MNAMTRGPIFRAAMLVCLLALAYPGAAKALYCNAAFIVRDEATGLPVAGASVVVRYADPAETSKDKVNVRGNAGTTDKNGFVAPRAYAGEDGVVRQVTVSKMQVDVEAGGYKKFSGLLEVFYFASKEQAKIWLYLDEVHLAPEGSALESASHDQGLHPVAEVQPGWGDAGEHYLLAVKVEIPAVLQHDFGADILRVAYMGSNPDPRKPVAELAREKMSGGRIGNEWVYIGSISAPQQTGDQIVESVRVLFIAKNDFHSLYSEPGEHHRWFAEKSGITLGGWFRRAITVHATISALPVRWVVADTRERARDLFMDKFKKPLSGPGGRT